MWQCIVCGEYMYSEETFLKHCGKMVQWINGIEGKGVNNMESPVVKIHVSGWIEMSQENLNNLMAYDDPHQGLLYSLHMGYCESSNLVFEPEE